MAQLGFYFDGTRCTGCRTCVLACKDYYDLPVDLAFRNVIEYGGGTWAQNDDGSWSTDTYVYHVSVSCNHCDAPACLEVCPQSAISKNPENGLVASDPDLCIGCGACASACPYGAPSVDAELGKSVKCTMCSDRLVEGKQPICVAACSTRALAWGDIEELRATYGDVAEVAPLPSVSETGPNLVIKEPVGAKPAGDETGAILNQMDIA
jgi:anaerobic dimethyl sulfoxide reductase subunit B (iron-sulfur subunit)